MRLFYLPCSCLVSRRWLGAIALVTPVLGVMAAQVNATALRVHISMDIRSTNPGVNRDGNTDGVVLHMVEGLVGYDAQGLPKPLLAERIVVSDDGLRYTFHLRPNVTFHNGQALTADDVLWSWQRYMNPKTGWRCLSEFDGRVRLKVEDVQTLDRHTVVFRINQPDPLFLSTLARSDCGMTAVIHRDSLKPDGSWDKPIGTGPFKFGQWRQREFISLLRFDAYASLPGARDGYVGAKRPLVDEVRFVVIPDAATAKAALQRGDIDILRGLLYAETAEFKDDPRVTLHTSPSLSPVALLFQTTDPLLGKLAMRQAIAAALDYDQLVDGVSYGLAQPNHSVIPLASAWHTAVQQQGLRYAPERLQRLLAEAGYRGERLVITTNKQYAHHFDLAVIVQAMLLKAGVNADIEVLEWGVQHAKYQKGNFQMMAFSYSGRMDPSLSFEAMMGSKATQPRKVWDDPASQALLMQSMTTTDPAARQALFDQLHRNAIAQVPFIVVFNALVKAVSHNSVIGYRTSMLDSPFLWEVSKNEPSPSINP